MFMGLGMPIPDLSNKPGPGRPGWPGDLGSYDFQFRVEGQDAVVIKANAAAGGSFTVQWPNGTTQVLSGNNASITAPDATDGIVSINNENDADYCDEFAVVGGKGVVREVISWGSNPWTTLSSAFLNCTNLTDISTTSLITGSGCALSSAFKGCTSLTDVNISSWDMTNAAVIDEMFRLCTGLEVFQASSLHVNGGSRWWLRETGTAVTDGCEYRFNGLNITATAFGAGNMTEWWYGMKINPASSFANISWPSIAHAGVSFQNSSITGVNSTLDCSGWTNYNSTQFPKFHAFTATEGGTSNMKIDITNLNVSTVVSFNRSFISSEVSEIVGLGGLGATAGVTNAEYSFHTTRFLKFNNHNLSSDFINSFNLGSSNFTQMFFATGSSLTLADAGAPPNLHNLDLSSVTSLSSLFNSAKFSSAPDFSNVTMSPTTAYNFTSTFSSMQVNDNSNVNSLFSKTFKVSSFSSTFQNSALPSIIIGNGVDFSPCTTMTRMFQQTSSSTNIELPTNMDLGNLTAANSLQYFILFGSTLSACQVDNFIRRLHATALTNGLTIDFEDGPLTELPAVVQSLKDDLVSNGWSITTNSTDATIPFEYTGSLAPNTTITPTNNTGSAFTGTFTSSNSNIAVNSSTGVINSPNGGSTTIRYTLANGCYTEQAIELISAEFSYSASAYCQNVADPTPTVTGTSGGTFSATLKVVPFKMQFEVASGTQKTISIPGVYGSSFTIDWGDGFTETSTGSDNRTISHTYNDGNNTDVTNPTVSINATGDIGPLTALRFAYSVNDVDLIDIPQWGNIQWTTMVNAFMGCTNANFTAVTATDKPDLSSCINLSAMFRTCSNLQSINNISNWDVGNITDMSLMFQNTPFNQGISSWNVSNVTNMSAMFQNSTFNQDIDSWDVSEVIDMSNMFRQNSSFNQDLNSWDVSKVENMNNMFYLASVFNGNIRNWNTGNVTNMSGMFRNASAFNEVVGSWDTSSVTNMSYIFSAAGSFNQDIGSWDVSNVTSFVNAIAASSFNNGGQSSINNWTFSTTSNINFQGLFRYANSFNQPINNWNISRATNLKDFLLGASSFNQTVTNMISTIQNTTRIDSMFNGSQAQADWSQFPFQYVDTSAAYAFQSNLNFTGNVSNWQIPSNVGSMQRMMRSSGITNIDYTDSIVGWAVYIYNNGGVPTGINFTGNSKTFDGTRTSDNTSGQSYTVKYSNWPSAWTNNNAQDAFDYLIETLNWNI